MKSKLIFLLLFLFGINNLQSQNTCIDVGVVLNREFNPLIFSNVLLAGERFLALDYSGNCTYKITDFKQFRLCNGSYRYSNIVGGIPCDGYPNGSGSFDGTYWRKDINSGKIDYFDLMVKNKRVDAKGYPTSIPMTMPSADSTYQVEVASIRRQINMPLSYPHGDFSAPWVLRYKGKGEINIGNVVVSIMHKTSNVSGSLYFTSTGGQVRMELELNGTANFMLEISKSDPSDPIRDMELLYPGTESLYDAGNHINPVFMEKFKNFKLIRFQECLGATSYKDPGGDETDPIFPYYIRQINFNERITPDWYWQNGRRGMALEYVIEICNQGKINPWVSLPYCASKEFCYNAAKLFMQKLDPDLIVYFELGYNIMFWTSANGDFNGRNNGFDYMEAMKKTYYAGVLNGIGTGAYLNDMFKAMGDGAGPANAGRRMKRVVSSWFDYFDVNNRQLQNIDPKNWEVMPDFWNLSFSDNCNGRDPRKELYDYYQAHPNDQQGFNALYLDVLRNGFKYCTNKWTANNALAKMYGKQLIFTEGGMWFIRDNNGACWNGPTNTRLTDLDSKLEGSDYHANVKYPNNRLPYLNTLFNADTSWAVEKFLGEVFDTMQSLGMAGVCYRSYASEPSCYNDNGLIYQRDLYKPYDTLYYRNGRFRAVVNRKLTANCDLAFQVKSNRRGPGQAMMTDGVNDYYTATINYLPDERNNYTFEGWFSPGYVGTADQDVFSMTTSSSDINFNIVSIKKDGKLNWSIGDNLGTYLNLYGPVLTANKWQHIAISKNGQRYTLYLNGKNVASANVIMKPMSRNIFTLGASSYNGSGVNYFLGFIDEIRLWNIARTENDIRNFMCKRTTTTNLSTLWSNLKLYYRFDDVDITDNSVFNLSTNSWEGEYRNVSYNRLSGYGASGAPIGDYSVYFYPSGGNWAGGGLSFQHPQGDQIEVSNMGTGSPDGVHLYYVDSTAWYNRAPKYYDTISTGKYWGVFVANGTDPSYDISYFYGNHPQARTGAQANMNRMLRRVSSDDMTWKHSGAKLNLITQSFLLGCKESGRGEYTLAFREDLTKVRPGSGKAISFKHIHHYPNDDGIYHMAKILYVELNDFTVTFWAKGGGNGNSFFYLAGPGGGNTLYFSFNNGTLNMGGFQNDLFSGTTDWVHYACVKKGQTMTLYVNGIPIKQDVIGIGTYTYREIHLFDPPSWGDSDIELDELSVFNTAVDQKTIRDYMCRKIDGNHPYACKNMILYFNFDEGTGSVLEDKYGSNDIVMGTMVPYINWTTSGAPIGDVSAYNYSSPYNVTLAHPNTDYLEATLSTGTPTFTQMYRVDNTPPVTAVVDSPAIIVSMDSSRYWGLYSCKPKDVLVASIAKYTVVDHYEKNGRYIPANELQMRMLTRISNADTLKWHVNSLPLPNTMNHTLTLTGQLGGEYVLGGKQTNTFAAATPPAKPVFSPTTSTVNRQSVCGNETNLVYKVNYDANVTDYTWTYSPQNILIGPGSSKVDSILVNANYTGVSPIQVVITVQAFNPYGSSVVAKDTITVAPSPSIADAGPDITLVPPTNFTKMDGNAPTTNETVLWQLVSGTATITNANDSKTTITAIGPGYNRFLYTITPKTGSCPPTQDSVKIVIGPPPVEITLQNGDPLPTRVCEGITLVFKAIPAVGFSPSAYEWTLPDGMKLVSQFTQFATVYMGKGVGGQVKVKAIYTGGTLSDEYKSPTVIALIAKPNNPVMSPKMPVMCWQQNYTITCDNDATIDSFDWSLPYGIYPTLFPKSISNSIEINTLVGTAKGYIKVTAYNDGCTTATASDSFYFAVDTNSPPMPSEKGKPYQTSWWWANGNLCQNMVLAWIVPDDSVSTYKFVVRDPNSRIKLIKYLDTIPSAALYDYTQAGGGYIDITRIKGTGFCNESKNLEGGAWVRDSTILRWFLADPIVADTTVTIDLKVGRTYKFYTGGGFKFKAIDPTRGRNFYWVIPKGVTVINDAGGLYDSTLTLRVDRDFAGYLEVFGLSHWGCTGGSVKMAIGTSKVPLPPVYVSGNTNYCANVGNFNITVNDVTAQQYIWTFPDGTIDSTASFVYNKAVFNKVMDGDLSVKARRGGYYSTAEKIKLTIRPSVLPPVTFLDVDGKTPITSFEICQGQTKSLFIKKTGAYGYRWYNWGSSIEVSTGKAYFRRDTLYTTANDTQSIWNHSQWASCIYNGPTGPPSLRYCGGDYIEVLSYNACGINRKDSIPYFIPTPPGGQIPTFNTAPLSLCVGSRVTYKVNALKDIIKYVWSLPQGLSASSIETTDPEIVVDVAAGSGGKVSVYGISTACGGGKTPTGYTNDISISGEPVALDFSTATIAACGIGDTMRFAVKPLPGVTNYTWTLPRALSDVIVDDSIADQSQVIRYNTGPVWWSVQSGGYSKTFIEVRNYGTPTGISFIGDLPYDGKYKVYIYSPRGSGWSTDLPIIISHAGGRTTLNFHGNTYPAGWVDLGDYDFVKGRFDTVNLGNPLSGATAFYDAARFLYLPFAGDTAETFKVVNNVDGPVCVTASVPACPAGYTICTDPINTTGKLGSPSVVQSPSGVCAGQFYTYVCSDIGAGLYNWILPKGMSINGDTGTVLAQGKTVEVRIDTFLVAPVKIGVYGSIKGCSVSSDTAWSTNIAMSVTTCPLADPVYDLEPDSVCLGSVVQYSILPIPGAETYEWTLPEGLSELTTGNTGVVVTNDNKIVVMVDKAGKLNALLVKAKSPTAPESVSTPTNSIMVFDVSPTAVISPETTCPGDSGMIWINKNKLFSYETIITGAASIDSSNIDTVKIVWGNNPQGTISVKAKKTSIGCSVEKKYNINLSMGDTKMTCPADEEVTFNMDVNATSVYKYVIKDSLAPVIESRCGWTSLTNDYDSLSNAIRDTITIQLPATMSNNDKANQSITWTLVDKAGTTHTCTTTISVITSRELTPYSAFSPNGDGVNDRFKIGNLNYYPGATVQIFNRWGELVYNCKKDCDLESNGWDGRDMKGNPVPFDSYHYIIYQNGKMIKMGSLVIVR